MILSIGEKISKEAKEGKRIQSTKVPVKVKSFGGKDDPKTTVESMNDLLTEEEKMMRKRSRSNLISLQPRKDEDEQKKQNIHGSLSSDSLKDIKDNIDENVVCPNNSVLLSHLNNINNNINSPSHNSNDGGNS